MRKFLLVLLAMAPMFACSPGPSPKDIENLKTDIDELTQQIDSLSVKLAETERKLSDAQEKLKEVNKEDQR